MKKQLDKKMRKIENKNNAKIFLVLMLMVLVLSLLIAKGVLAEETVSYEKSLTCNIDKICEKETANLDRAFRNAIANGDVGPNPKSADTPCLKPLIPGTNIGIKKSMDWSKDLCDNEVNYPFLDNQVAIQGGFSKELANAIAEAVDCYREEFSNELLGEEITRKAFERIGKISIILLFKDQNDNPLKNDGFSIQFKDTSSQVAHGIFIYHTGKVSSPPVSRILKRAMEEIVLQTKQLMIDEKYIQGKRVPDWIRAGLIYRCDDCDRKLRRQQIIDQWIKSGKYPDFSKIFESKIEIADPHSDDVISAISVVDFLLSEGSAKADKLFEIEREANRETTPGNKFGYERALEFFSSNRIEDLKDFQEKVEKYLQENKFLEDCYKQRKISKPADKSDETKNSNDKTSGDIPGFPKKGIIDAIFDSLVKIDLIPDYIIIPVVTSFEGGGGKTGTEGEGIPLGVGCNNDQECNDINRLDHIRCYEYKCSKETKICEKFPIKAGLQDFGYCDDTHFEKGEENYGYCDGNGNCIDDEKCYDDDNGINYAIRGVAHGPSKTGGYIYAEDHCEDSDTLIEYYCNLINSQHAPNTVSYDAVKCSEISPEGICQFDICIDKKTGEILCDKTIKPDGFGTFLWSFDTSEGIFVTFRIYAKDFPEGKFPETIKVKALVKKELSDNWEIREATGFFREDRRRRRLFAEGPLVTAREGNNKVWIFWRMDKRKEDFIEMDLYLHRKEGSKLSYEEIEKLLKEIKLCLTALKKSIIVPADDWPVPSVPSDDVTYNIDIYEACEPYSGNTAAYRECMYGGNDGDAFSEGGGTTCKEDDCTEGSEKIETSGVKCEDYGKYNVGESCDKDVPGGNCKACLLCNEYTGKCEVPEITPNTFMLKSIVTGGDAHLNDKQYLADSRLFEIVGRLDCTTVGPPGGAKCIHVSGVKNNLGVEKEKDDERGYPIAYCYYTINHPWPFRDSIKTVDVPINYNGDKEIFYRCFGPPPTAIAYITPGRISGESNWVCREGKCDKLCIDGDNGKNHKIKAKGSGANKLNSFIKVEDYCSYKDKNILVEYFCENDIISYEHKDCRDYGTGFVCKDGACVDENEQITGIDETETGIDYCQLCISSGDINSQSCQLCSYTEDTSVPSETGGKIDLNKILSENENCYYILKFTATAGWCGACNQIKDSILALAQKYSNKAKLVEIDVDNNKELVSKYGVTKIPRVIVLDKNWKPVPGGDFIGGGLVSQLDNFISRLQSQGKCQKKQSATQPPTETPKPPVTQPPVTIPPVPGEIETPQQGFETPVIVKNQEELKSVFDNSKECLFILDFYADWCSPCLAIKKDIERLANKYKGIIKVIKVDNTNPNDVIDLYVKTFEKNDPYKKFLVIDPKTKKNVMRLPTLLVQSKETIFKAELGAMSLRGPDRQLQSIYNPALEQFIDSELNNPNSDMSKVVKECTTCKKSIKKTDALVGEKIEKEFSIANSFNFDLRCRVEISETRESCKNFKGCEIGKDQMWISTDPDSDFIIKSGNTGKIKVIINVLKNEDMWGVVDIKCIKAKDYDPKYPMEGEVQLKECISIDIKVKKEQKPTETPQPPTQPPVTVPPIETPGTGAPGTTPGTTLGTSSIKLDPQCIPPLEKNGKLCKIQNPNDGCCLNCVCQYPDKIKKAITSATVRIEVRDSTGVSRGSGTIIYSGTNVLVLTCGHLFKDALKSGKSPEINIILYDENGNQIGNLPGELKGSNGGNDVAEVAVINKDKLPLRAMSVAPKSYKPNVGDEVISSGLSYKDTKPDLIKSKITPNSYINPPLTTVGFPPEEGRSGGGLFNICGALIGVNSCSDKKLREGIFANLDSIHQELDKTGYTWVYDQNAFDNKVKEMGLSNENYQLQQCYGKKSGTTTSQPPTQPPETPTPGQPGGGQQPGGGEPGQEQPGAGGQEGQGKPKGQQTTIDKDKNKCEDDKVTVAPCPPQTEEQKKCDEKFKKDKIAEKKQPDGKLLCGTWNSGSSQASAIDCGPCPKCYVCKNPDSGLDVLDLAFSGGFCEPVSNPVFSQGGNQFDVKPDCKKSDTRSIINDGCCQIIKSTTSSADTAKCGECPGGYTVSPPATQPPVTQPPTQPPTEPPATGTGTSPPSTGAPHCDCNENTCQEADKICGSLKDLAERLKKYCANAPNGVPYKTDNFIIRGNGNNCEFAYTAEYWRCRNAVEWTGKSLPGKWSDPANININVGPNLGSGGDTNFIVEPDRKQAFSWRGTWQGSREGLLDSVIPHEVMHTVSASHFGQPLPRWLDEGMSSSTENCSEKQKHANALYEFLKPQWYEVYLPDGNIVYARQSELGRYSNYPKKYIGSRGIAFNKMFVMKEYPRDIMSIYAQGWAVTEYLIEKGGKGCKGKQKFYEFVKDGMKDRGSLASWNAAVNKHYGFKNLDDLQTQWLQWIKDGRLLLCVKNN